MQTADIISSFGVSFILIAFFLSIFNKLKIDSYIYYFFNIIGGSLACYGSILIHSLPFTLLEATWTLVATIGLIKLLIKQKNIT